MAEENTAPEGEQSQEPSYTPMEQEALAQGWVPKDQFHGDESKWVEAGEFVRRGELFRKIEDQNRQLKEVRRTLVEIKKHHSDVQEVEFNRALATLRKEKRQALEDGDADAVIAADESIDLIREQQRTLQNKTSEPAVEEAGTAHPEFVAWTSRNSWYSDNRPMRAFADALGAELAGRGVSPSDVLRQVEAEVRKEFPNKFKNPNQEKRSPVEGSTNRSGSSAPRFAMSDDERRIMNTFVRQGVMTEAEYIKDLKKLKGVE